MQIYFDVSWLDSSYRLLGRILRRAYEMQTTGRRCAYTTSSPAERRDRAVAARGVQAVHAPSNHRIALRKNAHISPLVTRTAFDSSRRESSVVGLAGNDVPEDPAYEGDISSYGYSARNQCDSTTPITLCPFSVMASWVPRKSGFLTPSASAGERVQMPIRR